MKPRHVPVVSYVFESGAEDRIFDSLLLLGPLIIGLVIVLDRSILTEALTVAYIAVFVTYTLFQGAQGYFSSLNEGQ